MKVEVRIMKFKHLFAPGKIGNRYTKNRIVMSPMGENMANEDGSLSEQAFADAVIVATGSVPATPPIKGVENATQSWNILDGSTKLPKNQNVVMIGGGIVASVNIT